MARFEHSIEVTVPLRTAYNQWTQFEEFPYFMEGVTSVQQKTDTLLHWTAEIAGRVEEWDAEITDQRPDNRISWQSTSGAKHSGLVTFHYLSPNKTLIMLVVDYDPNGFIENVGAALGVVQRRMAGDLKRFKEFIEGRGYETGAWRGEVNQVEEAPTPWGNRYSEKTLADNERTNMVPPHQGALAGEATHNGSARAHEGGSTRAGYTGAPSFTTQEVPPGRVEERGERNDVGDNNFTSGENLSPSTKQKASENWSTSKTPSTPSSAPINDIGNSDVAPGEEPAHSMGAVESEPQDEQWEDENVHNSTPTRR